MKKDQLPIALMSNVSSRRSSVRARLSFVATTLAGLAVTQLARSEVVLLCVPAGPYVTQQTMASCTSATSTAEASLATGLIRVSATYAPPSSGGSIADAYLRDTITLQGPWTSAPVTAYLRMVVDGSYTSPVGGEVHIGALSASGGNGQNIGASLSLGQVGGPQLNVSGLPAATTTYGNVNIISSSPDNVSYELVLPIELTSSSPAFFFQALSRAYPYTGGVVDFSHTSALALDLPEGYSFTSSSGVFLSASPVPLPAGVWLLLSGIGVLGAGLRKKKSFCTRLSVPAS